MKNFALLAVIALLSIPTVQAQPRSQGNWREKVKSEKIAFITTELNLTPEEAQVFWPVYNQIANEKQALQKAMMTAFRELRKAIDSDNVSDKEINKLLDKYLAAKQAHREAGKGDVNKYRKILSGKKVAKLYIAEEKFRRQNIRNMRTSQGVPQHPQGGHGAGNPGAGK